jgi:hypothetical protein
MSHEELIDRFDSLPPEAQRRVIDFIQRLQQATTTQCQARENRAERLSEEPFIGMWSDRDDMVDSSAWVRASRKREW